MPTDAATSVAWHAMPADRVLARVASTAGGLSEAEAGQRLAACGTNRVIGVAPVSAWEVLRRQLASVVAALLAIAAGLALAIGEAVDALAILAVLALNVAIGFATEWRARRSLDSLRALDTARATVVRGGRASDIDAATLVPGDVLLLDAGGTVPADARLLAATELRVVEAALTGESRPVAKCAGAALVDDVPLAERSTMVYKATGVAAGSARAVVVATGTRTEVGRIGALVASVDGERTPLERRLDALGRRLAVAAVAVAAIVSLMNLALGDSPGRVLETGIAVAIAAIPEGLPAVVTITMAVGVRRMARRRALIRRLPTVESLGAATVVCADKTGTLTEGEMTVTAIWLPAVDATGAPCGRMVHVSGGRRIPEGRFSLDGHVTVLPTAIAGLMEVLAAGTLANRADLSVGELGEWRVRGDPTDGALLVAAQKAGIARSAVATEWPELAEVPFSSERMLMATFHQAVDGATTAFAKGAPSRILDACTHASTPDGRRPLDGTTRETMDAANRSLAARGQRVLGVASGTVCCAEEQALRGLTFLGLVALDDPPAPGVPETIRALRLAGIRTVMLTGDQRLTAESIACSLGLAASGEASLDGPAVDGLSDAALADRTRRVSVYSRVSPATKLRLVRALQRGGDVVAMLGDGVNDAPALRQADVGVAMGRRGTDVAKDAAGVVLADDRFATVAAAVEEGRVVYANIRRFVFYLLSCNVAEILVLVGAGSAGFGSPLLPLQLLWLNLLTDTLPALALAFEPADADVMCRPPRNPRAPLMSGRPVRVALLHAAVIAAAAAAALVWGLRAPGDATAHDRAVAMTFMTLALAQVAQVPNARRLDHAATKRSVNRYAGGAIAITITLQLLAGLASPLAHVLHVAPLGARDWLVIALLSVVPAAVGAVARRSTRVTHPSFATFS